jgi:hypothetical protein
MVGHQILNLCLQVFILLLFDQELILQLSRSLVIGRGDLRARRERVLYEMP